MNEYIVRCPCCGTKTKISIGSDDKVTVFLFDEKLSQKDVFEKSGIELGILEREKEVSHGEK